MTYILAQKRDHDSAFQSDIIIIFVGPEKKRFTAHKSYLTKCQYFTACLEGGFKEGNIDEISLPEDDPEAFDLILQFLYHDKLPSCLPSSPVALYKDYTLLLASYIAADKYCIEELQNQIVSVVAERCKTCYVSAKAIMDLIDAGLIDSKLRRLLLQNLAYALVTEGYEECCKSDDSLATLVQGGGINSEDVLKATMAFALTPGRKDPALIQDVCDFYHVHNRTKKCEKPKK